MISIYLRYCFAYSIIIFTCICCRSHSNQGNKVIVIQPFIEFPSALADSVYKKLKTINPNTALRKVIPLPAQSFYSPRNRYRADSLIDYLNRQSGENTVVIGLTNKDISSTKGSNADWGVMGLGYCPGNACIVSTFRLSKHNLSDQLYKVAIHEAAHTEGLPHCTNPTCLMRDAEGENILDKEKDFCSICTSFLKSKGWQFENNYR